MIIFTETTFRQIICTKIVVGNGRAVYIKIRPSFFSPFTPNKIQWRTFINIVEY